MAKLSKVIKKLEKFYEKYGDIDCVVIKNYNSCCSHNYANYNLSDIQIANPKIKPVLRIW
jgi:hypothetical protein